MKNINPIEYTPSIAVATLDAKAYYALASLLNEMNLSFKSVSPGSDIQPNVQLILTTYVERRLIKSRKYTILNNHFS